VSEIVNSTYVTLDGVIEHPETWPDMGGFGVEGNKIQTDLVLGCDAVLMGRRTYESFASVWPTMSGNPLADKMNEMPKYVASSTLDAPAWNNTHVIEGDLLEFARQMRAESEGDVVQFGFGAVTQALLSAGLVDRLRLWLHPILVGRGGPEDLLHKAVPATRCTLERCTPLESGIVVLDYRVTSSM